jgi:hypothetical protein
MKLTQTLLGAAFGLALLGGCSKKEEAAPTETTPSASAPVVAATPSAPPPSAIPTPPPPPKPVNNEGDASAMRACCAALRKAADAEKNPATKGKYTSSASVCDAHVNNVKNGTLSRSSALGSIRASLGGKPLPGGC